MLDWNVVVSVRRDYARALAALRELGLVERTGLYNILVMRVADPRVLLDQLVEREDLAGAVSHVVPVTEKLRFASAEELEDKVREVVSRWPLAGKSVLVRLHRRGGAGGPPAHEIERRIADAIAPDRQELVDPDAVITIETIRDHAGVALWTRADLERYRFLRAAVSLSHPHGEPLPEPAPSRQLLGAVTTHAHHGRPATASEILELLGELEAGTLEQLVATGATIDEIAEAVAAIEDEDAFGELSHPPHTAREAEVRAILEDLAFEDFEERESEIAHT